MSEIKCITLFLCHFYEIVTSMIDCNKENSAVNVSRANGVQAVTFVHRGRRAGWQRAQQVKQ